MFERYAVFYTPTGALAEFGASWLGWDSLEGCSVEHPAIDGIDVASVTNRPRKYGLHGTLKAPFRLAQGADQSQLQNAASRFATQYKPFAIGEVQLRYANGFVALRPLVRSAPLQAFAGDTVKAFDPFRAPSSDADIARRRKGKLSARHDQQLLDWGYPFIFDDFHFHLTVSGGLSKRTAETVISALHLRVTRFVPNPLVIDGVTLMGQDADGMFHQIHRYALTG